MPTDTIDRIMEQDNTSYERASEFINIRKNLQACIDMEKFIDRMKEIINNSKSFSFRSDRAERYIDKKNPIFILKSKNLPEDIQKKSMSEIDRITDKIKNVLQKEIINSASNALRECINVEDYGKVFKEEDTITLLTSIYIMRLSTIDNCIYLSWFR